VRRIPRAAAPVGPVLKIGLVALISLVLAGCSYGTGDPLSRLQQNAAVTDPAGPASPAPSVTRPWHKGIRQYGIGVYWQDSPTDRDEDMRKRARKVLDHVVRLGANSLSVSFPFFMDGPHASVARADDPRTPSPDRLAIVLDEANRRGLRTTIRPILDEYNLAKDDPRMWRGAIAPADRGSWFASMRDLLVSYATVAQAKQVATFVVGTELTSLERDPRWSETVAAVRVRFGGELGYSANHDRLAGPAPVGDVHKLVDAYPALALPDSATVPQLVAGWHAWLNVKGRGPLPDLVLSEVAIGARAGAYREPWSPHANGLIVPQIQQRWFAAACQVVRERNLGGMYFWMINMDSDPAEAPPDSQPMDFVGRPAERDVVACFAAG
jgi:hypothetical protein